MELQDLRKRIRLFKRIRKSTKEEIITVVNQFPLRGELPQPWKYTSKGISLDLYDITDKQRVEEFLNSDSYYNNAYNTKLSRELKAIDLWEDVLLKFDDLFYKIDPDNWNNLDFVNWDKNQFFINIKPRIIPKNYKLIKQDIIEFCKQKALVEVNLNLPVSEILSQVFDFDLSGTDLFNYYFWDNFKPDPKNFGMEFEEELKEVNSFIKKYIP